jgi:hypothetical protein
MSYLVDGHAGTGTGGSLRMRKRITKQSQTVFSIELMITAVIDDSG